MAEWALWLNSFSDVVYRAVWGDKDTYALAFGVAGKAHVFNQLQVRWLTSRGVACNPLGVCFMHRQTSHVPDV